MSDSNQPEKLTLRVDLKGEALTRFNALKERYGLNNDTELIRLLISQEYHRLHQKTE